MPLQTQVSSEAAWDAFSFWSRQNPLGDVCAIWYLVTGECVTKTVLNAALLTSVTHSQLTQMINRLAQNARQIRSAALDLDFPGWREEFFLNEQNELASIKTGSVVLI